MQHKKDLKFDREKDPLLTLLAIFFVCGTAAIFLLAVYYMSGLY